MAKKKTWFEYKVPGSVLRVTEWGGFNDFRDKHHFPGNWKTGLPAGIEEWKKDILNVPGVTSREERVRFWWNTNKGRDTVVAFTHEDEYRMFQKLLAQYLLTGDSQ